LTTSAGPRQRQSVGSDGQRLVEPDDHVEQRITECRN
jgi:hypothetical protein